MKSIKALACIGLPPETRAARPRLWPNHRVSLCVPAFGNPFRPARASRPAAGAHRLLPPERLGVLAVGGGCADASMDYTAVRRALAAALCRGLGCRPSPARPGGCLGVFLRKGTQGRFFNAYPGKTLIIPRVADGNEEKVCYFVSEEVIDEVLAFAETLTSSTA